MITLSTTELYLFNLSPEGVIKANWIVFLQLVSLRYTFILLISQFVNLFRHFFNLFNILAVFECPFSATFSIFSVFWRIITDEWA